MPRKDATRRPLPDGIVVLGELLVLVDVFLLLELPDLSIWRARLLDQRRVEDGTEDEGLRAGSGGLTTQGKDRG